MEEQPVIVVEPPKAAAAQKRDWFGVIVSLAALVTSAVSIILALQNSDSMNRLVQANSWPYLQFDSGNVAEDGSRVITFSLRNAGLGPLTLESFVVAYEGEEVDNLQDYLTACCVRPDAVLNTSADFAKEVGDVITSPPLGTVLGPGDELILLELDRDKAPEFAWKALDSARFRSSFRACYCSVFDECWKTDFATARRTQVKACPEEPRKWQG